MTKILGPVSQFAEWLTKNKGAADVLAGVIGGALSLALGGKLIKSVKDGVDGFKLLGGKILDFGGVLGKLGGPIQTAIGAIGKLSLALLTSPWFWVIAAIVLLVVGFILLWEKCAWFRDLWKGVWNDIKGAFDCLGGDQGRI